eukprot:Polyplicarium_translucidae@DN3298_c0_g1_i15.p2
MPMLVIELAVGQRMQMGFMRVWRSINSRLSGLGLVSVALATLCAVYYNVIVAWSFFYLFNSFRSPLPWAEGGLNPSDSAKKFWLEEALRKAESMGAVDGKIHAPMMGCLSVAWIVVYFCVFRGSCISERNYCMCLPGWGGNDCSKAMSSPEELWCPEGCNARGECDQGECQCFVEFYGDSCAGQKYSSGWPPWAHALGWLIALGSLVPLPLVMVVRSIRRRLKRRIDDHPPPGHHCFGPNLPFDAMKDEFSVGNESYKLRSVATSAYWAPYRIFHDDTSDSDDTTRTTAVDGGAARREEPAASLY